MHKPSRFSLLVASALLSGGIFSGCASFGSGSQSSTIPLVQNCAVLNTGTPSRFACNGKVYTSFQLAKLREDEAQKYASGK